MSASATPAAGAGAGAAAGAGAGAGAGVWQRRRPDVVPARAALAGNPSDGHGGAVVALPLPCWVASAVAHPSNEHLRSAAHDRELDALVAATLAAAERLVGAPAHLTRGVRVDVDTTIPRSVGLAGSSAIAIATLRALRRLAPEDRWATLLADPPTMAVVAQRAEVDGLGLAAGLQDRLVQAAGRPLLMEFGPARRHTVLGHPCGTTTPLAAPPGHLLVAHRPDTSESSGAVHERLAGRADTAEFATVMDALAGEARRAAAAIEAGDVAGLGAAMDRTFERRALVTDLDRRHVEMIEVARRAGAHANYTGSGGAIVVLAPDRTALDAVADALRALPGCEVRLDPHHESPGRAQSI
ncbi:MAG: hypothetical protein AAGG08_13570 [Actinomycetota bacterium]